LEIEGIIDPLARPNARNAIGVRGGSGGTATWHGVREQSEEAVRLVVDDKTASRRNLPMLSGSFHLNLALACYNAFAKSQ